MGGNRTPDSDPRSGLYLQFCRALELTKAKYFITENVAGLAYLNSGKHLKDQLKALGSVGKGYNLSLELVNSKDYGVPQERKRLIIVGVRKDLSSHFHFPNPTHGNNVGQLPFISHGDETLKLTNDPDGEYYNYEKEPFSWWYLSRNRKRPWDDVSYTIQANWRYNPLHPASPTMRMVESNWRDGSKETWEFTKSYEHIQSGRDLPVLERPRRLSWRESAVIQTFPIDFEPVGSPSSKQEQIGNATPPLLVETIVKDIVNKKGFRKQIYSPKSNSLIRSLSRIGLLS
jgi:DNA (cytosine-5)-methyltransferase 1